MPYPFRTMDEGACLLFSDGRSIWEPDQDYYIGIHREELPEDPRILAFRKTRIGKAVCICPKKIFSEKESWRPSCLRRGKSMPRQLWPLMMNSPWDVQRFHALGDTGAPDISLIGIDGSSARKYRIPALLP